MFRFVVYVVDVVSDASNIIFHLAPSHSTMSLILATRPVPSAFAHAAGTFVADAFPTSSNKSNLTPAAFIDVGL